MSEDIHEEFGRAVNMTATQLQHWLDTDESKQAGQHKDGGESTGHRSGRRIVTILQKKRSDISDDEEKHMHTVVSFVKRHSAQRPSGDVTETTWRHSLMNWGHDPMK